MSLIEIKGIFWVTKLVGFVDFFFFFFFFRHFVPEFPYEQREKEGTVFWMAREKKNRSLIPVMTGKCQPSGPPLQWETRQA